MGTGVVRGVVSDIFVGKVDLGGGDIFEPIKPMVFGSSINGLDKSFVGLSIFILGRMVKNVTVSVGYVAKVVFLFLES